MKFIGRERELSGLEKQYHHDRFEFSVIYGRRRVGKTWLIRKFIDGKPAIFFTGIEASSITNLESMSQAVHRFSGQEGLSPFVSFPALFAYLSGLAQSQRIILVIDEYSYLAASSPEIPSLLQRFCDHEWASSKLHLILCGSSMSFMERQVLGAKSPLYGRRTAQYLLKPFTFFETQDYLSSMTPVDVAILHCATGGIAEYLSFVDQQKSLEDNLVSLFLESSGRLFEEPANLLKQELREPRVYNDILDAIASGSSKSNEIATKAHVLSGALNHYLDALVDLGIISREKPILNQQSKKTIYKIVDGCFRFWYRFVMPNLNAVHAGLGQQVYNKVIAPDISEFMGQGFEQIFVDYFDRWNATALLPDLVMERGRWWGNNPKERREEEIDLVGIGTHTTLFCEVKWRHEKVDAGVLADLERKSLLIPAKKRFYIVFSKTGFTDGAQDYQEGRDDILLRTFP